MAAPHPFRPRLTVRVGVAGHRWNKIKPRDAEAIRQRLEQVFGWIEFLVDEVYRDLHAGYRPPDPGAPDPEPPVFRVLSGLAEGADRLGAHVARGRQPHPWQLTALLPFSRSRYVRDFKRRKPQPDGTEVPFVEGEEGYDQLDPGSVKEFEDLVEAAKREGGVQELDGNPDRPGGYRQLATALCLNSDVVVAVWDGDAARPGGTGDVVGMAGQYGIPVVRVPVDGVANPWLHDPAAGRQGQRQGVDALADHIRRLLVAPRPPTEGAHQKEDLREVYFTETAHPEKSGRLYDWFLGMAAPAGKTRTGPPAPPATDHVEELRLRWEKEWEGQGVCVELRRALLDTGIHRHHAWASRLANYYAGRYRDSFLSNYMLSWMAVAAAAIGVVAHQVDAHSVTLGAAIAEFALLIAIVRIVWRASRKRFHARWLDYRRLAEAIRMLPMLLPLSRTPVRGVESNPLLTAEESWVDWMFRAVVREGGVIPLDLSQHLGGARSILAAGVLDGQIEYHRGTAARNARADRMLYRLTIGIFGFALMLATVQLTDLIRVALHYESFFPSWLAGVLNVTTLVLPAVGAALHALRSQGEFELTALRSERIRERLVELREELGTIDPPSVEALARVAVDTATVMNSELGAWLMAYQSKAIDLS